MTQLLHSDFELAEVAPLRALSAVLPHLPDALLDDPRGSVDCAVRRDRVLVVTTSTGERVHVARSMLDRRVLAWKPNELDLAPELGPELDVVTQDDVRRLLEETRVRVDDAHDHGDE